MCECCRPPGLGPCGVFYHRKCLDEYCLLNPTCTWYKGQHGRNDDVDLSDNLLCHVCQAVEAEELLYETLEADAVVALVTANLIVEQAEADLAFLDAATTSSSSTIAQQKYTTVYSFSLNLTKDAMSRLSESVGKQGRSSYRTVSKNALLRRVQRQLKGQLLDAVKNQTPVSEISKLLFVPHCMLNAAGDELFKAKKSVSIDLLREKSFGKVPLSSVTDLLYYIYYTYALNNSRYVDVVGAFRLLNPLANQINVYFVDMPFLLFKFERQQAPKEQRSVLGVAEDIVGYIYRHFVKVTHPMVIVLINDFYAHVPQAKSLLQHQRRKAASRAKMVALPCRQVVNDLSRMVYQSHESWLKFITSKEGRDAIMWQLALSLKKKVEEAVETPVQVTFIVEGFTRNGFPPLPNVTDELPAEESMTTTIKKDGMNDLVLSVTDHFSGEAEITCSRYAFRAGELFGKFFDVGVPLTCGIVTKDSDVAHIGIVALASSKWRKRAIEPKELLVVLNDNETIDIALLYQTIQLDSSITNDATWCGLDPPNSADKIMLHMFGVIYFGGCDDYGTSLHNKKVGFSYLYGSYIYPLFLKCPSSPSFS